MKPTVRALLDGDLDAVLEELPIAKRSPGSAC
jgi:hypothetical protein